MHCSAACVPSDRGRCEDDRHWCRLASTSASPRRRPASAIVAPGRAAAAAAAAGPLPHPPPRRREPCSRVASCAGAHGGWCAPVEARGPTWRARRWRWHHSWAASRHCAGEGPHRRPSATARAAPPNRQLANRLMPDSSPHRSRHLPAIRRAQAQHGTISLGRGHRVRWQRVPRPCSTQHGGTGRPLHAVEECWAATATPAAAVARRRERCCAGRALEQLAARLSGSSSEAERDPRRHHRHGSSQLTSRPHDGLLWRCRDHGH